MEINYSGKSALIVDSKLEDLGALRQILSRIGVGDVQVASSVNMALTLMREIKFDLCFAAYEMGKDEKNGLQLLQEANAEELIPEQSTYFLIVDPESSELLFGSLENSPDTYISKPFDSGKIRNRIEKQLRIKETIRPIEQLLDEQHYEEVLERGRDLIKNYPGLAIFLQRINGIALLRMKRFTQAKELFVNLTEKRDLPWAEVGRGIAHFNLGEYMEALRCLNRVVDQQHVCVEAYTWLARIYRVKGELSRAVTLMRKAVMIQPTVPALQSELADLACQTGEWDIAKGAYQQAIRYARYSSFQTPSHYYGLVRSLIMANKNKLSEIEPEVVRVLEDAVLDHPEDEEVMFRAKLINCDLYRQDNSSERLNTMMQQTWNFFLRMNVDNQSKWLDVMVDAVHGVELEEEVQRKRKELGRHMMEQGWGKANYVAMTSFRKGDLDRAFMMFGRANELLPEHVGIALNLVQAGVEKAKRGQNALWILLSVRDVLSGISFGALPEKQQQRYTTLSERYVEQYKQLDHYGEEEEEALAQELS
ncbi:tetratricopeptide repeat protein [Neptuniibacter caesariensis]|uniref:Response regulator/TPR domain protein n=1 Tax=Neptuniibacter caesariensis TaxID=207954 RepID=A0A7U8GRE9_NEPCE|nr:tetratricopeptide repeat protein [Neptuniibacter caesariensis]EAR60266.1 response regulator/TPR domain protein [Oceanospirillum sp. MED92] [Neptuniibacter caesariensis]